MGYYTTDLNIYDIIQSDESAEIVVSTATHQSKVVQLYIGNQLSMWHAMNGQDKVSFTVSTYAMEDGIFILAVDLGEAETDYFDDAYPVASSSGDRINVELLKSSSYAPDDKYRIYLDDVQKKQADLFPSGIGATGFGMYFGGSFGYDAEGAIGWGQTFWGSDEWGISVGFVQWRSQPQNRGTVTVKVSVLDSVLNESTKSDDDVTIATYPRPATNLVINSYTDPFLNVTFTPSGDF